MTHTVHILLEPSYIKPVWYVDSINSLRAGAAKRHYLVQDCYAADEIVKAHSASAAIVISTSDGWTQNAIATLKRSGIRPILVGAVPQSFGYDVSGTIYNRRASVEQLVHYFSRMGRDRIALVGLNPVSSNDQEKQFAFISAMAQLGLEAASGDIFPVRHDLDDAIDAFLAAPSRYNGAICANDYVAVALLAESARRKIRIPDDLVVAGFGNHLLGRCSKPTLTTATMDYREMGVQALTIWETLQANPKVSAIVLTVQHQIICRGSTGHPELAETIGTSGLPAGQYPNQRLDSSASLGRINREIRSLEQCLRLCDELDYKIICELLAGHSYEAIGFRLYLSRSALSRRLKKMYQLVDVSSRSSFLTLLNKYIANFSCLMQTVTSAQ
ncbi:MAG: LacI family transcriptional regulator [Clostridiaceae bacterium]|nr:substrate-binding domain-containing protein [Eubacteriales bacterium]NLB45347.1 LacI family transcriptional regulator [Clostridiaceae bacterium]